MELRYVCSEVDEKMNNSEIVKSVNIFMAIEWGKYKCWTNSTSSLVQRKPVYSGRSFQKGDSYIQV